MIYTETVLQLILTILKNIGYLLNQLYRLVTTVTDMNQILAPTYFIRCLERYFFNFN